MKRLKFNVFVKFFIGTLMLVIIYSCGEGASYKEDVSLDDVDISYEYDALEESVPASLKSGQLTLQTPADLKIIKTASVRYKVKDVKKATLQMKQFAMENEAYISDLRFENTLYQKESRFTIKVPQKRFDMLMDSLSTIAEFVDYENISTKDVTEEYVDLQSRLATKLEVQKRYEEILRKNARTVEDILNTEEKLRVIQEEIEATQGRLKYLTNRVAYSTIQVDLYETVDYKEEPDRYRKSFGDKSKEGLEFGWEIIETVILFFIHIWPLLIIGIFLILFIRWRLKKN